MNTATVTKDAIAILRRELKRRGFASKGTTFHRRTERGNTILIQVQKSRYSTADEAKVTLNFGIYSARLGARLGDENAAALDLARAHGRERPSENGQEKWWAVYPTDSPAELAATWQSCSTRSARGRSSRRS